MKTLLRALIVVAPLLAASSRADAQFMTPRGDSVVAPGSGMVSGPVSLPSVATYGVIPRPSVGGTYIPPHSYYVLPNPYANRHYSGYGTSESDFPFYGRAYGHRYDAWTWPYLSGSNYRSLAKYYSPPL